MEYAQNSKIDEIVIIGNLAEQVKKAKKVAAIISASAIGITLVVSIFKGYDEIEAGVDENGRQYICLRRKSA